MERTVAKFSSHKAAENANLEFYRSLTPQQRFGYSAGTHREFPKRGWCRCRRIWESLSNR